MSEKTERALRLLTGAESRLRRQRGLVGLDGFVDQILRVVDKRASDGTATYISTIPQLAARVQGGAGTSNKFELCVQQVKLGGNGPIMANAMAAFGLPLTCIGNLGWPEPHAVFQPMKKNCELITVGEPGCTDALEFDDGKIMLSRQEASGMVTWETMQRVIGRQKLIKLFQSATFVALDNWSALPHMAGIWMELQGRVCPRLSPLSSGARRKIFFDLADPEFRLPKDTARALKLIGRFQRWYDTTLGLNQKEAGEICEVLRLHLRGEDRLFARAAAMAIREKLGVDGVVVHANAFAAAASAGQNPMLDGPFVEKPLISTGAGDHFNAGYSLGLILEGDLDQCLQLGVATSGYYVRTARSPSLRDLRGFLNKI